MRFFEWLSFFFYAAFALLGWVRPLAYYQRFIVTGIAVAGIAGIIILRETAFGNWLPIALILMAYWQTGQFPRKLNQGFQAKLESFERKLGIHRPQRAWILEIAYLFCYPFVPLGLVCLYISGLSRFADEFWNVVLPPAYACYATFPFLQTLPPRAIEREELLQPGAIRKMNLFVLRHISVQRNTFPSGHVAASLAVSLTLMSHAPTVGTPFLLVSLAIAGGAVYGRYHYTLDVFLGALLATVSFLLN